MIVEIWQYHDDPNYLVMCVNVIDNFTNEKVLEVINGWYHLTDELKKEVNAKFLGKIDWPWINEYQNEDYDITLERFKKGERAEFIICSCCNVGSWRNEKGEKIEPPNPDDYPWRINDSSST